MHPHHNYIGLILCRVPTNEIKLPSGETTGAIFSSIHDNFVNNVSRYNFTVGYLVADGSNLNKLTNNDASDNGTYDFELVGNSERFGFYTPPSHDNVIHAGSFQNVTIKVCGINNYAYGGQQVNLSLDPCTLN